MKKTIEMKIAKNGNIIVKTDDGIETSRKFADAVAALADTTFTGKPDVEIIVDRNDDSHICDIYKGGFDFNQSSYIFTDNNGNEYSFWDSHLALKQFARGIFGEAITVKPAVNEANPDEYAVSPDALEVAVNAEIQNANNVKINDLKWEIRYVEGSINDLDKNHIAHFPNDQSLKERRAELVNELAALNAQLAELLPTEIQNANNEAPKFKYYLQSRRPIAGAVPNGYISATQGEMKVHSLRSDGSISPVPRKVVFGVVVYDHPLSDQQIINYDLHVDPLNPKAEPATEVDPIIQERDTARNEYCELNEIRKVIEKDCERYERLRDRCKAGSPKFKEYNQLLADFDPIIRAFGDKFIAAQDRYNKSLTLRTDEERAATQKAIDTHNADLDARGIKYFATVYYYPNGVEGEDMETFHKDCTSLDEANAFVSQEDHDGVYVGGIYDAGWQITDRNDNLVADHNTGLKEENTMTNREKLLALRKEYIITDRLSENNSSLWYVNGKRSSQVKVWNLLQEYGLTIAEFLAEEEAYINECIAASCKQIAIKGQADSLYDKIKRECASIDDSTTDRDEVFNLLPDLDNDVEKVWLTKGELDDLTAKFRAAVSIIPVTTRIEKGLPVTIKITKQNSAKPFDMGFGAFAKYSIVQWQNGLRIMRNFSTLGIYDTPAQVEKVIDLLKAAITRGDKAFTFPTVEELIDPPELPTAKPRTLRNSINRAIKQCIRNRIGYLKSHNSKMEKYEYELLCLLQGARRELEVA